MEMEIGIDLRRANLRRDVYQLWLVCCNIELSKAGVEKVARVDSHLGEASH